MNILDKVFTVQQVLGTLPPHIPTSQLIFNAPRPLYGETWQGDFRHGIFYAAVDPYTPDGLRHAELNHALDGWIIEYISKDTIWKYGEELAEEYKVSLDDFDFDDVWSSYTSDETSGWRRQMTLANYMQEVKVRP